MVLWTITGNTTITAVWKELPPEVYTVSFDAGEGSGEMANVTVIEGNTYTLPECSFTAPAKHEFYEWTLGEPGANVTITGNTTITALWKSSIYDNSSVIALNITDGYAGKFAPNNENATFRVDAPIQQFIGAVIATNFTNHCTNESGIIGSTIFDLRKNDNKAILDYLSNTTTHKIEGNVLYFNKESGNVVGVISSYLSYLRLNIKTVGVVPKSVPVSVITPLLYVALVSVGVVGVPPPLGIVAIAVSKLSTFLFAGTVPPLALTAV